MIQKNHNVSVWLETAVSGIRFKPDRQAVEEELRDHARRVYRSLSAKFGGAGQKLVARGFLTCLPDRELWLWRLIQKGYRQGVAVTRDLTDPVVDKVNKAVYHLEHEAHLYTGFVRFSDLEGVLVGEIEPKNRVLPLLRPHFCGRYPQERFVLHLHLLISFQLQELLQFQLKMKHYPKHHHLVNTVRPKLHYIFLRYS